MACFHFPCPPRSFLCFFGPLARLLWYCCKNVCHCDNIIANATRFILSIPNTLYLRMYDYLYCMYQTEYMGVKPLTWPRFGFFIASLKQTLRHTKYRYLSNESESECPRMSSPSDTFLLLCRLQSCFSFSRVFPIGWVKDDSLKTNKEYENLDST